MKNITSALQTFRPRILFAYLFGSTGTAWEDENSDLDIAVYLDIQAGELELDHKLFLYSHLNRKTKRNDVDVVVLNTCSNLILLYDLLINGRVIYEADSEARMLFECETLHTAIDFKEQRERIFG
ncbi:MAG: nucleotidyltransferase domain-containing protein [Desulfovermiculus sp.]|nr:nucleotidyltransferase domain-containing protein [Desulfovermiculus sp.]